MKNNSITLKLGITIIILFFTSTVSLFSQGNRYSINAGTNVSWFSSKTYYERTTSYWGDSAYILKVGYTSKPSFGYYLNNDFSISIQKNLCFKTGFGISNNIAQLHVNIMDTLEKSINNDGYYNRINNGHYAIGVTSISIPMQIEFDFLKEQLYLSAGLMFNIPQKWWGSEIDDFLINGRFGIDYRIYKNLHFSGYYEPSISKIRNNDRYIDPEITDFVQEEDKKFYMNSVSFGLSYKLK